MRMMKYNGERKWRMCQRDNNPTKEQITKVYL